MKTKLCCLAIIAAALLLGQWQASQIKTLESRIGRTQTSRVTTVSTSRERENETDYRSKHHHRKAGATASQVFERLLPLVQPRPGGNAMGLDAALQHREAMKEIFRLDLDGVRELMSLVSQSKELAKIRPMPHIASILCMIAMADADPQAAFAHLMEDKKWNQMFSPDDHGDGSMVAYVLARMALDDPGKALGSLRVAEGAGKISGYDLLPNLLGEIARKDPWLAFDNLAQQPEERRNQIAQYIGSAMETADERTAMFRALRDRGKADQELVKKTFESLCATNDNRPDSRKWLESLGMTHEEKIEFHEGISQAVSGQSGTPLKDARWIAGFMPASPERDSMIWDSVKTGDPADMESIIAFFREQGIDPQVMIQREREMNSR
jgi:hypothetical protein